MGTNILRFTTNLLPEAESPLPVSPLSVYEYNIWSGPDSSDIQRRIWTNAIVPIGCLYSVSLVLSNAAYVHLSVSLVQMIKVSLGSESRKCRGPTLRCPSQRIGVDPRLGAPDLVCGGTSP